MTSITWAGPSCVQELGTFLAPQKRTQGRCVQFSRRFVYSSSVYGVAMYDVLTTSEGRNRGGVHPLINLAV